MKQASPLAGCARFQEADLNRSLEWPKDVRGEGFSLKKQQTKNLCTEMLTVCFTAIIWWMLCHFRHWNSKAMMNFCCPQSSSQRINKLYGMPYQWFSILIFNEEPWRWKVMSLSLADLQYLVSSAHSQAEEAVLETSQWDLNICSGKIGYVDQMSQRLYSSFVSVYWNQESRIYCHCTKRYNEIVAAVERYINKKLR